MGDTTENNAAPPSSLQELAARWLFHQGVSTVLLFAILAGLIWTVKYVVPQHLAEIQAGYDRQEGAHEKNLKLIIDSQERSITQLTTSWERERQAMLSALRSSSSPFCGDHDK